ncbi:hypothetical protein Sjap_019901 [Stephania japonica]|uniref:F-box domain-containing protein n=1 Tax=Stephania japonica TaxID=461633 RepID=A0AAP0F561_9MAGN
MDREHNEYAPELPDEILNLIVRKLMSWVCHAAFRSVCRSWRSFSRQHCSHRLPPRPPWIMFPCSRYPTPPSRRYALYSFDGKRNFFQFKTPNCMYFGSSGTWLIFIDSNVRMIRVWNPLSLIDILLPYIGATGKDVYNKMILSCPGPLIKNAMMFGIIYNDNKLAFMRLGDNDWTKVNFSFIDNMLLLSSGYFTDIIFHGGKLHALHKYGILYVCEEDILVPGGCFTRPHRYACLPVKLINNYWPARKPHPNALMYKSYLVEVDGDLMIALLFELCENEVRKFFCWVFKLDWVEGKWHLVKLNLKGRSLFLGRTDCSMSALTSRPNEIYYKIEDRVDRFHLHWYLMRMRSGDELPSSAVYFKANNCHSDYPNPLWLIPGHT